jgi:hypothetical protein
MTSRPAILIVGSLLDTADGEGGFEFYGPYASIAVAEDARKRQIRMLKKTGDVLTVLAVELLSPI